MSAHEHSRSSVATTRILHARDDTSLRRPIYSWIWPLPRLDGAAPCILPAIGELAPGDVELGYPDRSRSSTLVPVFAARDGIVTYAGKAADGSTVCIDHAGGW